MNVKFADDASPPPPAQRPPAHSAALATRRPAVGGRGATGRRSAAGVREIRGRHASPGPPPPLPPRVEIIETSPTARLEPVWRQSGPPQACGPAPRRRRRPGTAGPARARSVGA